MSDGVSDVSDVVSDVSDVGSDVGDVGNRLVMVMLVMNICRSYQ